MNSLVEDKVIQQMVDTVVSTVDPQQVILFGSYSQGNARSDSDIDFLVVTRDTFGLHRSRRKAAAQVWRVLAKFGVPTDVLMYSTDEVARWQQSPNHIIYRALQEGKVLYERSPAGPATHDGGSTRSESTGGNDG
ncbi:MAG TPA: nucleotidyltransferase domain-containing protein [Elainellaceae cyanobacterium]|jgi:predicted nucleotidyltransferase